LPDAGKVPPEFLEMLKRDLQDMFYLEEEDIPDVLAYFCEVHGDAQKSYTVRQEHRAKYKGPFDGSSSDSDDEQAEEGVPPDQATGPSGGPSGRYVHTKSVVACEVCICFKRRCGFQWVFASAVDRRAR
jgi:hypothetical protein